MRLNRYLALCGLGSRRAVEELIVDGRVTVNGDPTADLATQVIEGRDAVEVDGRELHPVSQRDFSYILLNKPKGYDVTRGGRHHHRRAWDLLPEGTHPSVQSVGRLDRNSTGLLLFTNDGELAFRLSHPRFGCRKVYEVEVDQEMPAEMQQQLRAGVELEDGLARAVSVERIPSEPDGYPRYRITMEEGRNRIVRRMCEAVGRPVANLNRSAFGPLSIADLPRGKTRPLTPWEVRQLKKLVSLSGPATGAETGERPGREEAPAPRPAPRPGAGKIRPRVFEGRPQGGFKPRAAESKPASAERRPGWQERQEERPGGAAGRAPARGWEERGGSERPEEHRKAAEHHREARKPAWRERATEPRPEGGRGERKAGWREHAEGKPARPWEKRERPSGGGSQRPWEKREGAAEGRPKPWEKKREGASEERPRPTWGKREGAAEGRPKPWEKRERGPGQRDQGPRGPERRPRPAGEGRENRYEERPRPGERPGGGRAARPGQGGGRPGGRPGGGRPGAGGGSRPGGGGRGPGGGPGRPGGRPGGRKKEY